MFSGNMWILLGVITLAFSAFSIPYGFYLKDKEKNLSIDPAVNVQGDFVNGDKIVNNGSAVNAASADNKAKFAVAKLKIARAFKDFNDNLRAIRESFAKDSNLLAAQANARNVLTSGPFIQAQMDLSVKVKRLLDKEFEGLKRQIEDILVENLGVTTLQDAGAEFNAERSQLDEVLKSCKAMYPWLNDNARSWEMKALQQSSITKTFDVANF